MSAPRLKVSITLAPELLAEIDSEASRTPGATRSSVMEEWLRRGRRARAASLLREGVVRYYEALAAEERAEEEAMARASTTRSRRVSYE